MAIEAAPDPDFVRRLIPLLTEKPLAAVLEEPFVAEIMPPLVARHERSIGILRERTEEKDGTIFFDITDQDLEGYNKFIPYYLFPQATYTVSVSTSSFRTKVSVGSNPWVTEPLKYNLASICERYGGGGHPKVGAISFEIGEIDKARNAAQEIAAELQS
jgi:hypothetical protein